MFVSVENAEHNKCVDFFFRPNGTFGFEEFRRDIEDRGQWTPIDYYSGVRYSSSTDALVDAERRVPWLADARIGNPELKARIGSWQERS